MSPYNSKTISTKKKISKNYEIGYSYYSNRCQVRQIFDIFIYDLCFLVKNTPHKIAFYADDE